MGPVIISRGLGEICYHASNKERLFREILSRGILDSVKLVTVSEH